MRVTSLWRTMSFLFSSMKPDAFYTLQNLDGLHESGSLRSGRSICVISPVTIILVFIPIRVRNILICWVVVFWASSRITTASFSVRPRMKASGGNLDDIQLHVFLQLGSRNHVLQGIVQRLQVRIDFILHVARQETQFLARFHGRAAQDDFLISLFFSARTASAMAV